MRKCILCALLFLFLFTGCGKGADSPTGSKAGDTASNTGTDDGSSVILSQKGTVNGSSAPDVETRFKGKDEVPQKTFCTVVIVHIDDDRMTAAGAENPETLYLIDLTQTVLKDVQGGEATRDNLLPGQLVRLTYEGELGGGYPGKVEGTAELQMLGETDEQALQAGLAAFDSLPK